MKPKGIQDKESQKINNRSALKNENVGKQGQQANIKINTTHQGLQQDR